MDNKIYIIGHQSPDLDSVAAAIIYADYKNKKENANKYIPVVAGQVNKVTEFVLNKFGFMAPEILQDASNQQLILVDHNEESQQVEGENKDIIEILDHHKINFAGDKPIRVDVWPLGSSNSIIYNKYKQAGIKIDKNLAGLMLSAVLDDTVITKSPTCTEADKNIIQELSDLAGISDWQNYGIKMFKVKSNLDAMSENKIIKMDYKDFMLGSCKFGIGQVETVDLKGLKNREDKIVEEMDKIRQTDGQHTVMLVMTDILQGGSQILVSSKEPAGIEEAFNVKLENNRVYIDGLISRKKQIVPALTKIFDN
ncbi:MAG: manganese-dependent inorganic pyrophosphatase [Patescibacteria group bacterium]|nr:manganese-dependent inorganic pyrophosphatase [Patescibacteria group bacterium]